MKNGVKHFIAGCVLFLLSTFFVPQGVSEFARSAAFDEPPEPGSGILLAIGAVLIIFAIALFARGQVLRHRARVRAAAQRRDESA